MFDLNIDILQYLFEDTLVQIICYAADIGIAAQFFFVGVICFFVDLMKR